MNVTLGKTILHWLSEQGVESLCLCHGGRNAPIVAQLEKTTGFDIQSFYDERSAAFFALGKSRRNHKPVAVITTSGTAVSETLSAVIEGHYSHTPIVVVSADRPPFLRGTGAPQTIDQVGLFNNYVENVFDLTPESVADLTWSKQKPLHINLCFDEPLIDENIEEMVVRPQDTNLVEDAEIEIPESFERPLLVLSGMNEKQSQVIESALLDWPGPIFAECLSGLKSSQKLKDKLIMSGDPIVRRWLKQGDFDSVIRIGDVPVGRFWRDLDKRNFPVLSFSNKAFSGLKEGFLKMLDLSGVKTPIAPGDREWRSWKAEDQEFHKSIQNLVAQFPQSEVALVNSMSQQMVGPVYLGNSMPVRNWDLVAHDFNEAVFASRGANGIDGQLSTALGLSRPQETMNVVLGDLTTLYDVSGFWPTSLLREKNHKVRLFVINNGGGQIFSRIFESPLFLNQHQMDFEHLAKMWGWSYQTMESSPLKSATSSMELVEVRPDPEQSQNFWKEFDSLWLQ